MPAIKLPDGTLVNYPDGMDPELARRMVLQRFSGKHGLSAEAGESAGWTGDLKSAALSGLSSVFAGLPGAIRAGIGGDWNNPWLQRYRHETETIAPSYERASTQRMREEATKAIEKAEKEGGISSGALEAIKQFGGSRLGILSAVQSLPGMLAGAGVGGLAGRGITAALPSLAGRKAAISAAGAVGSEAVMEGAEAAGETYRAVYEEAIKKGLSPEEANRIADSAAKKSAAASAGVTATLGALPIPTAEKLLAGRMAGKIPGGRLSTAGLGALGEIPTEMAQAATGSIGVQRGLQELLPEEERTTEQLLKGVGGAMGQAAVGAGMIGGGAGFLSGGRRPPPPAPAAETPITPPGVEVPPPPSAGPAVPPPPAVVMTKEEKQAQKLAYKNQIAELEASGLPPETIAQIKAEIGGKLNHPTPTVTSLQTVGEILKKYQPQGGANVPGTPADVTGGSGIGAGMAGVPTGGTPPGEAGTSAPGALGGTNAPAEPTMGGEGAVQPALTPAVRERFERRGERPKPQDISPKNLQVLQTVFNQPEEERISDLDNYTFTASKPGGSNPGGIFSDKSGGSWLVKGNLKLQQGEVTPEQSDDRAGNEVLAAKLISLAGAGAPEMKLIDLKGKYAGGLGVASKMQYGLTDFDPGDQNHVKAAQKDYAIHAWLANYDVLGMGYDNMLIDQQGLAVNIDPGGALLFRAQGLPKAMLDPTAPEFESMRNTTPEQKAVFGKISPEVLKESAKRLQEIDDSDINDLVDRYGPKNAAKKAELKKVLIARKEAILEKAGVKATEKAPSKPATTETKETVHPQKDENGKQVVIKNPSTPVVIENSRRNDSLVFVPNGEVPTSPLNGVPFEESEYIKDQIKEAREFKDPIASAFIFHPMADDAHQDSLQKIEDFLALAEIHDLKPASGAVIMEPDGRIWTVSPTNGFGGAKNTIPKGGLEVGLTPQENAIKEVYEETGLEVKIVGFLGNFVGTTSLNRIYIARRVSGTPAKMGWESQAVNLSLDPSVTKQADIEAIKAAKSIRPDKLSEILSKPSNKAGFSDDYFSKIDSIREAVNNAVKKTKAEPRAAEEATEATEATVAEVKVQTALEQIDTILEQPAETNTLKTLFSSHLESLRKAILKAIEDKDAEKFESLAQQYSDLFSVVMGLPDGLNSEGSIKFPKLFSVQQAVFNKDINGVADAFKSQDSEFLKWIGNKIGSIPDLKIVNDQELIKKNTAKGKVTHGLYKPSDKSLHFNLATFSGQSGLVGHELVHAIAQKSISYPNASQKPVVKKLKDLYETVKAHPALQGEYGLKNVQEFVAEGFTNPDFQIALSLIPYESQSAWGKFTTLIANLIGVPSNQRSAFIELVALTEQLTDLQATKTPTVKAVDTSLETSPPKDPIPSAQAKNNLKKWLGNTKHPALVDTNGHPKVLYHGSYKKFFEFKPSGSWGGGIFASTSAEFALNFLGYGGTVPAINIKPAEEPYVKIAGGQKVVYPVYIKAENPWDYENPDHVDALVKKVGEMRVAAGKDWSDYSAQAMKKSLSKGDWPTIEDKWPQKAIKALGHDACFMKEGGAKNIQVYSKTQIKSVFNKGTYDPNNPEVLKSESDIDRVLKSESRAPAQPQPAAPKPKKPLTPKQQAFFAKKAAEKAAKKAAKEAEAQQKAANLIAPNRSWIDDIRRKFQNVQISLYKLSDAVKEKLGGILPPELDLGSALSLSKGEQAANFEKYAGKLERRYTKALGDLAKALNVKVGEAARQLDNYLLAKHELERRSAIFYERRATLTDENEGIRTFLRSAIVANDKELAKLKKDFKADIKTAEQQRIYDLVDQSQDRAKDLYQEIINVVNNDPVAMNLDFNATTYDVVAYENENGEEVKMTPQERDRIIAEMEAKFSNAGVNKAVEEARLVQKGLDKAIQEMNKAGNYTSKGAARLMEARNWQSYVPQRGVKKEDSDFEYYGESGSAGLSQSEAATAGRGTLADNVVTRTISEAKKAAGRTPGNRIASIVKNYVDQGYIKGKVSKTPLTTLDNYVFGKSTNRGENIFLYRDENGEIYEVKVEDKNIVDALNAKTHDLIPVAEPLSEITRLMAQTNTRYNPMFWLKNFFVDPLTNTFIIGAEQGLGAAWQYASTVVSDLKDSKGTAKSMNFIRLYNRGDLDQISELAAKDPWYRDALEYVNIGGKVSYLSGLRNETQMEEMYKKLGPNKIIRTVEQLTAFVDPINEGLELALRVSAFRTAKTFPEFQGDVRKAAAYAKDLANFEQIGQWGKWMGAWFMFSRPSATGASRLYDALSKGKYAKEAVLTATVFGSGIFFLSMLMSGDDDEGRNRTEHDDPARWVRNWRLFIPGFESPIQIPWGFGLGSFAAASAQLSMFLFGKSTAKEFAGNMKTIASEAAGLPISQMSFLDNPSAFLLDSITPAPAKPLLQMIANTDTLERTIFHKGQTKYVGAYMGGENIPESVKALGETLFDTFKEVLPPSMLKVLSPDGLHFLANSYVGGVYRTMNQLDSNLRATGIFSENEQKDINVVKATLLFSPFIGTAANYDVRKYSEMKSEIEQYKKVLRTYKDQAPEKYADYKDEHPGRERAVKYFEKQESSVLRDLQKRANEIKIRYKDSPKEREDALKENRERQNAVMRRMVERTQELLED